MPIPALPRTAARRDDSSPSNPVEGAEGMEGMEGMEGIGEAFMRDSQDHDVLRGPADARIATRRTPEVLPVPVVPNTSRCVDKSATESPIGDRSLPEAEEEGAMEGEGEGEGEAFMRDSQVHDVLRRASDSATVANARIR